jgi:lipopolysaccharide biosynthesis glycosyltransferase
MINLVYCGNEGIFKGILMSLYSAQKNTKEALNVYLLSGDFTELSPKFTAISEKQRAFLEKMIQAMNPESRVSLLDVAPYFKKELASSPNLHSSYTPYTLLRLFMDRIPSLPEKVLYLDADTVVMKDLANLYAVDLGDNYFAGVLDAYGRYLISPRYCNAGVLLLNLSLIKERGLFPRCLALLAKKHYFFPDQSVLNKCAKGHKLYLPREDNEQKKLRPQTVIRHYCNQPRIFPYVHALVAKPWDIDRIHKVYKTSAHDTLYRECSTLWEEFAHE